MNFCDFHSLIQEQNFNIMHILIKEMRFTSMYKMNSKTVT